MEKRDIVWVAQGRHHKYRLSIVRRHMSSAESTNAIPSATAPRAAPDPPILTPTPAPDALLSPPAVPVAPALPEVLVLVLVGAAAPTNCVDKDEPRAE